MSLTEPGHDNGRTYSVSTGSDILLGIVVVLDELGSKLIKGLERGGERGVERERKRDGEREKGRERIRERVGERESEGSAWLNPKLSLAHP